LYPKVRFRGFDEPWKKVKLGRNVKRIRRKNKNLETNIPLTISAQFGLVDQRDFFGRVVASENLANYILLKRGEFAYNKSYSKEAPYGSIKRLEKYNEGALSTLYIAFTPENINSDFLKAFFDTTKWYSHIVQVSTEGARNHGLLNISPQDFFEMSITIPKSDEQNNISRIYNLMNSLLSLQQRKLELEKQLKFFLFQNAIPSKEAVIFKPKIRFREFQDKWKYAKLSEIYNTDCSGGTPSVKNKTFYGGNIPFLTISDLNNKKIYKTQKTLSKKGLENSSAKLVPAGSISLAMYASVGKIGILSKEMATSQAFFNMTFDDDEKRDFIYIILEKANFDKEWIRLISTGTQNNLNAKKIRNFHIVFPTYKALKGLNKLFCNIDTDIDIQYKVIVTTNQLKQFLLQNLFI